MHMYVHVEGSAPSWYLHAYIILSLLLRLHIYKLQSSLRHGEREKKRATRFESPWEMLQLMRYTRIQGALTSELDTNYALL